MSVYEVTLRDCLHSTEPPGAVLRLTVVGDTLFLSLAKYDQKNSTTRTTKDVADIAVSLPGIREALQLLSHDEAREAARPQSPGSQFGEREASISGLRLRVLPL